MQKLNGTKVLFQDQKLNEDEQHVKYKCGLSKGQICKFQAQHIRNAGDLGCTKSAFGNECNAKRVDDESQDKEKVDEMVVAGMSRAEAAAEFTGDAAFEEWYDSWYQKLNDTAHSNQ